MLDGLDLDLIAAVPDVAPVRTHAEEILARYSEVDAALVAKRFPPTSPWWRETFTRWYRKGCRWCVIRAGRRAGKSSSLSRLAVVEALYGQHDVPPGDLGMVAIISTNMSEGKKRLRTIEAILGALGVPFKPLGGSAVGIELLDRRVGFQVFAASIAGVSGFTAIFILADEVAKWKDADTGANPATEVLASVRPTMATMPNARGALSSSPMGKLDAHHDAYEQGDTEAQVTAYAPSWVANPTLSEAQTRADEPDESTWLREYAAIPQAEAESSLLSEVLLAARTRRPPQAWDLPPMLGHHYVATLDPASRGNACTLVVATRGPDMVRRVVLVRQWVGTPSAPVEFEVVFAEAAVLLKPYGLAHIHTDQWAVDPLTEIARRHRLTLLEEPWTMAVKAEAYGELKRIVGDGEFECHPDPLVAQDLLGIRKVLTRTGFRFELVTVGARHSDYAPAVAMAVSDARFAARPAEAPATDAERAKVAFLEERRREREKAQRVGRTPPSHRARAR